MYRLVPPLLIIVLAACTPALTPQEREAASHQDVHRLVQVSLTERLRSKLAENYRQQVMALLPADPAPSETITGIVDEEIEAELDRQMADLEERLSMMFEIHFSPEEIQQLLAFHESEVGRKSREVSAEMSVQSRDVLREWNQQFEQALLERLTTRFAKEGIDF